MGRIEQEYTTLFWRDREFIEEEQIEKLKEALNKRFIHEAKEKWIKKWSMNLKKVNIKI